ncbi:hypothetical protein FB567DRAFT_310902 [Paraphoma chrysanthemicola]|uniref:Peptidase A1 domain-containing protein n=1 Tax=Paraphoma chrysanthemicola TaxID=798071 RepID=A0A8K0W0Y9_9PLEO|nr:hypothetical protein FB567DRAFT_310902 [Paraphoma chrysanthemicola]
MFNHFFLATLPLLGYAAYSDQQQKPLQDHKPDVVVPLKLDDQLHYSFDPTSTVVRAGSLEALQSEYNNALPDSTRTVTINIPIDASRSGSVVFSHAQDQSGSRDPESSVWFFSGERYSNIPLDDIGIRKGGMVGMPAVSASLTLETPYIHLPADIFAILLQATHTSSEQDFVADCGSLDIFPDLVFGLRPRDVEDDEEREEIIVTPEQYIMRTKAGKCFLLVRSAEERANGREDASLGWAAIRGRSFVLDRSRHRMGFAQ